MKFAVLIALWRWRWGGCPCATRCSWRGVLALGGEFAFVVFGEARACGLIDAASRATGWWPIVGLSMALTPLLLLVVSRLLPDRAAAGPARAFDAMPDDQPQVLIAGFGRFGQIVARLLCRAAACRSSRSSPAPSRWTSCAASATSLLRRPVAARTCCARPARTRRAVFVVALEDAEASLRTVRTAAPACIPTRASSRARATGAMHGS